jgi:hypothetical protein
MSMIKGKRRFLAAGVMAGVLTYAFWPQPVRPAIFYAYSDNTFSMWGLTLYKDGRFYMTLPAAYEEGHFFVSGDTITLQYDNPSVELPAAYFINRNRKQIEELCRVSGKWTVTHNGNWAALQYDSTRYYSRL